MYPAATELKHGERGVAEPYACIPATTEVEQGDRGVTQRCPRGIDARLDSRDDARWTAEVERVLGEVCERNRHLPRGNADQSPPAGEGWGWG